MCMWKLRKQEIVWKPRGQTFHTIVSFPNTVSNAAAL